MLRRRVGFEKESGETLVELIVSITILAIVAVAIGTAITVSVLVSDQHRKQTVASEFLHNDAEVLQSIYQPCSTSLNYVSQFSSAFTSPQGYSLSQTGIKFWSGSSWVGGCPDNGLQQVTLNLRSNDGRANEYLVVTVRRSTT